MRQRLLVVLAAMPLVLVACGKPASPQAQAQPPAAAVRSPSVRPLTHGRYNSLTYVKTGASSVNFTFAAGFRRSYFGTGGESWCVNPLTFAPVQCSGTDPAHRPVVGDYVFDRGPGSEYGIHFGDGSFTGALAYRVDVVDESADWIITTAVARNTTNPVLPKTYASSANTYLAFFESCCRVGSVNAPLAMSVEYRVESLVSFTSNTASPGSTLQPIVDCALASACAFFVPAADPDTGNTLRFRFSASFESGLVLGLPAGVSIDPSSGLFRWVPTPASAVGDLYAFQVTIEERTPSNTLVSKTAIDFLIRLVSGNPPKFDAPPSPSAGLIADPGAALKFKVQASDADGGDTVEVGNLPLPEGASITCAAASNPNACDFTWTPDTADVGPHVVGFTATDSNGLTALPYSVTITVAAPGTTPPVVSNLSLSPSSVNLGGSVNLTGLVSDTGSGGSSIKTAQYSLDGGQTWQATALTATDGAFDEPSEDVQGSFTAPTVAGTYTVCVRAADALDATSDGQTCVTLTVIDNLGPVASGLSVPSVPVAVNTPVALSAVVSDATTGGSKVASAEYALDANPYAPMTASDGAFDGVSENVQASVSFSGPGVYNVCVRGTDQPGNTGQAKCADDSGTPLSVVVYDPNAGSGFVVGGGWINSPSGAYTPNDNTDPDVTGRASFGFVSKYQKGATTPSGQTEFQFRAANLDFHSDSYQWLVVAGARAQYKGSGSINGSGNYGFILTAVDGQVTGGGGSDKFRMKIWDNNRASTDPDYIVYDNQAGASDGSTPTTGLGGGNITIQTK